MRKNSTGKSLTLLLQRHCKSNNFVLLLSIVGLTLLLTFKISLKRPRSVRDTVVSKSQVETRTSCWCPSNSDRTHPMTPDLSWWVFINFLVHVDTFDDNQCIRFPKSGFLIGDGLLRRNITVYQPETKKGSSPNCNIL